MSGRRSTLNMEGEEGGEMGGEGKRGERWRESSE